MYMEKTDKGEQKRTLYIQTLGTVRLTLEGRTISLHTSITGKAFQLFLLLAYTGTRGVTRTALQDALYDRKTTDAANALRINASRLRKLLLRSEFPEHNYIVVDKNIYYLTEPEYTGDFQVDVVLLEQLWKQIQKEKEIPAKRELLEKACKLYEGEFLPALSGEVWVENLNGTGGNAYVWAPVSVLHYDATEGKINAFGTAVQGNAALVNTRGDGSAVGNAGYAEEASDRYATDYTIFGNSMNLTEGELPAAVRDGYKFAGWYVADNEGAARDYAASGNWAELNKLLNTRFMADSKVSEDITDVSKGQEEKTIYAKWVLPSQYNIVINYIDERAGAHITASYNSDYMEEGSSYDVASLLNRTFDGYTWIRYEGGQAAGSLNSDLVFNVYYNSNTPAPTPGNGGGSGSSGGGSSSGSRGSIITDNGGPGVTIQDENVPLAELPSEALPQEAVSIPEEDVPLAALPKTGQSAGKEIGLFVSALVLGAAGLFGKRTKED